MQRDDLWFCMRKVAERYTVVVPDMYLSCKTVLRYAVSVREKFKEEIDYTNDKLLTTSCSLL